MSKQCAHIASTESTECPELRNQGGAIDHQIRKMWGEFIYIDSTGVIPFGGNKSIVCFMVQIPT